MKTENSQEKKKNTTINYTDQWIFEKSVYDRREKKPKKWNTKDVTIKRPIIGFILEALIFLLFVFNTYPLVYFEKERRERKVKSK